VHLTAVRDQVELCHDIRARCCFDRSTHPLASQTLTRSFGSRNAWRTSTIGRPRQKQRGLATPPCRERESGSGQIRSIDLIRSPGAPAGLRRASALVTVAVSVAEHERWRDPELALEARAPLLPALLVLELVLVQRRRLLDAVSEPELDGQLAWLLANLIPGRTERELVGDGSDAARVDVARQRDGRQDRTRPVRGLRVDRHRENVQVVATAAVAGHHRARGPRRRDLARRRPVALGE